MGIRTTRAIEESFYDATGNLIDLPRKSGETSFFMSCGFSDNMQPIKSVFELKDDLLVTQDSALMTKADIKKFYCH